ncbi:zinc metalloprotease [Aporhodopirellula aestuarii]|uniref:Peptidase M50 n=1 Tax=Aporhodopirellula aestuarii TaxID=2950107 RepID=A0ABT0U4L0_9BACT|nr:peptidase M50 [Aporhodopirellula aestuarii]MCM2371619.1 peptidase M50 [Aporhodopirellula aestuarii]
MSVPRLELRSDLISRQISLGDRCVWVLKDPLSQAFHFFDEAEFGILRSLAGGCGFAELEQKYRGHVESRTLARFLSSASRAGLLVSNDVATPSRWWRASPQRPRRRWWSQPLAIRLPGFTPDRLFARLPKMTGLFLDRGKAAWWDRIRARHVLIAILLLLLLACSVVGLRLDELLADSASASQQLYTAVVSSGGISGDGSISSILLIFALAVVTTKVIHEIGHAWVCSALGGRCREVGVLLLLGIPCLYCDVSDTWLMPRRRDRILVSATGMIAEWIVASIAVLVWATTQPGVLHDLSALIVMVASISTVLINANPLLRYDGYYMLSDWAGVPNLSTEAGAAVRSFFSGLFQGEATTRANPWLVLYGIASTGYRMVVYAAILWAVYTLVESRVGVGAALPITAWLGFVLMNQFIRGERRVRDDDPDDRGHGRLVSGLIAAAMMLLLFVPLPRSLRVGALVRPEGEMPLYVSTPGTLVSAEATGNVLKLDDWRLRLQELMARGRVGELRAELAAAKIDRLEQPERALLHPILQDQLSSAEEQHATIANRLQEVEPRVQPGMTLFDPPIRRATKRQREEGRWSWTGVPLRREHVGATMESGTLVGRSGHPTARTVSLFVPQESVDALRPGQSVSLGYRGLPIGSITGRVEAISTDPVDSLPDEIVASGWASAQSRADGTHPRREVLYEVTVSIDEKNSNAMVLPARLVAAARVDLPPMSLFSRWRRWMADNF